MQTTVQDYPGRLASGTSACRRRGRWTLWRSAWPIGSSAIPKRRPALECTMTGPTLRFHATPSSRLPARTWARARRQAGAAAGGRSTCRRARSCASARRQAGARAYIAIRGGIDVPEYLGSRSTFILGRFGGHADACCRPATCCAGTIRTTTAGARRRARLSRRPASALFERVGDRRALRPARRAGLLHRRRHRHALRRVVEGPLQLRSHRRAPDRPAAEVGAQGRRRSGLHPSNIHDNAYAVGAMDFTGDMPILLGPDGPSLGGFVCPAVIAHAELWKIGQLRAGDTVRFRLISNAQADADGARARRARSQTLRRPAARSPRRERARSRRVLRDSGAHASTARPAIAICWSKSAPTSSTSTCASACTRSSRCSGSSGCTASSTSRPASARCRSTTTAACCRARS